MRNTPIPVRLSYGSVDLLIYTMIAVSTALSTEDMNSLTLILTREGGMSYTEVMTTDIATVMDYYRTVSEFLREQNRLMDEAKSSVRR